ncbi:microsomal glutathione S-transferase 1-like isoform X3 [Pocillopora damicornis]|uniref:microsomal glutathione S-transferase 1-like isoform X3 n=1 Tax=Pocillopora damicornis TaxID=46731 RepID=UPI000F54CF97|nr:microsomal glutathione S-transferase 1-like isoform X3 [Pocillopora damicornis]XP_058958471.1 microsomal glutathione S-transferase 1-like isoform X3 [Pocillopora verrucosa]
MITLKMDDRFLAAYLFYGAMVMLKTWVMSFLTSRHRIGNKALPSPEDYGKDNTKPVPVNPDVERVRRAHLNDLENIPIFMIVALLYGLSGEPVARGIWCLRIFTGARFLHTIAYLNGISVPRALGFLSGSVCTAVLGFSVLYSAVKTGVF